MLKKELHNLVFLKGNENPDVTYADREGKYMGQGPEPTLKSINMQKLKVFGPKRLKGQIKYQAQKCITAYFSSNFVIFKQTLLE